LIERKVRIITPTVWNSRAPLGVRGHGCVGQHPHVPKASLPVEPPRRILGTGMVEYLERFPASTYFILTVVISWGGVLLVIGGISGIPGTAADFDTLLVPVVLAMLAGPSIAAIFCTWLFQGTSGLGDLLSRLLRWKVDARWYALALVAAPLAVAATLLVLSSYAPVYLPGIFTTSTPGLQLMLGIVTGLAAGFFEELGWTGFATPQLRRHYSVVSTGIIIGLVWGLWHLLVVWWGSSATSGDLSMAVYLPAMLFSFLPPYRVLMTWVYERTGSVLIGMLMHAALTASVRIFDPLAISGAPILVYNLALGAVLWIVVAAILSDSWMRGLDLAGLFRSTRPSQSEWQRPLPGDSFVPVPAAIVMHAITIAAPPEQIWPWLAQMGSGRAGWYSYDWVDNEGHPSANEIIPRLQNIAPGDILPSLPRATDSFVVAAVRPAHDLVLTVPAAAGGCLASWEFFLEPQAEGTRLLVRGRVGAAWPGGGAVNTTVSRRPIELVYLLLARMPRWLMAPAAKFGHAVMQRRQLTEIKRRAEAARR
jgi:membrane protease YdiL (CAAX protease family)